MAKLKKSEVEEVKEKMLELYPDVECALKFGTVFQLLISVVLSAQTTDKSVNEVTPALFERCPDAEAMAKLSEEELQQYIHRIGMYKTKSKNVSKLCRMLVEQYGGVVPEDYDKLVELPGVGRKTANVVLAVGFGQQRIAVDTHVFRLANRIGLTAEKDVLHTELALMKALPEDCWTKMHHALIWHGRRVCTARNPKCQECGLLGLCRQNGLNDKKPVNKKETEPARAEGRKEGQGGGEPSTDEERRAEMKEQEQRLYHLLSELHIKYERNEHPAVYTTEEAERLCTDLPGLKLKNLFVKDRKTGAFYLVLLEDQRRLDFKALKPLAGWKNPTFASPEELWERLRLTPGSVTAFGLANDTQRQVTVILDRLFSEEPPETPVNFHPCINTATIAISLADFRRFLDYCGNTVLWEDAAGLSQ